MVTNTSVTTNSATNAVTNNFYASNTLFVTISTVTNFVTVTNLQTNGAVAAVLSNTAAVTNSPVTTNDLGANYAGGGAFTNSVGFVFSGIPAGSNWMGDTNQFTNRHMVTLSAFYMNRFETTWGGWTNVLDWATNHGYSFGNLGALYYEDGIIILNPVVSINWYDMVKWCNALSEKELRTPCYYLDTDQTNVYRTGESNIVNGMLKMNANGYRLPTEAEWEYACRAGTTSTYYWGEDATLATNYAWYSVNASDPSQAGEKLSNNWELYDINGNVSEWCWDNTGLSDYYLTTNEVNPLGIGTPISNRVIRGDDWTDNPIKSCSYRFQQAAPTYTYTSIGFRIVTRFAQ